MAVENNLVVFGAGGMLGKAVYEEAQKVDGWTAIPAHHGEYFNRNMEPYRELPDGVYINCAGVTRQVIQAQLKDASPYTQGIFNERMVKANSWLPHYLTSLSGVRRVVQVSTDCVFDGERGVPYTEVATVSPTDLYSLTKAAGELLHPPHLTVRCSFIGFSPSGRGLLSWLTKLPSGSDVDGWLDVWSGYYVKHIAKLLVELALDDETTGLLHLQGTNLSKWQLLCYLNHDLGLGLHIAKSEKKPKDLTLTSIIDHPVHDRYRYYGELLDAVSADYSPDPSRT